MQTQSPWWFFLFLWTFRMFLISVSVVIIIFYLLLIWGLPGGSVVKNPPVNAKCGFDLWVGKIPWRRKWQPTPVFLPGKSYGQRSLAGYSPWGSQRVRHDLVINNMPVLVSDLALRPYPCFRYVVAVRFPLDKKDKSSQQSCKLSSPPFIPVSRRVQNN